jgi:hypothetical protein
MTTVKCQIHKCIGSGTFMRIECSIEKYQVAFEFFKYVLEDR